MDFARRGEGPDGCMAWSFWRMMVFFLGRRVGRGVCIERESGDCDGGGYDRESRQGGGCIVPMESMIP